MTTRPTRRLWIFLLAVASATSATTLLTTADRAAADSTPAAKTTSSPAVAGTNAESSDASPYPKPSPYQVSWELKFDHSTPRRITVQAPGETVPAAYWYITYKVTNNADEQARFDPEKDRERTFYPVFEMLTSDGKVTRSDFNIVPAVFNAIKGSERNQFLEPANKIGGRILLGEDQAREGVAIWREPALRIGGFTLFVSGMWGETASVKGPAGKDVTLQKTLMLEYHVNGDEIQPGRDPVEQRDSQYIMR
jgi:hypothetical protein